jgi:hypothetical protein
VTVENVDCRTDSCVALLRFPSYGHATGAYVKYVTGLTEPNCATSSVLAEPDDPEASYEVELLLTDCQTSQ